MILKNEIYYNRTLHPDFANLLEPSGDLRWLFDFVKSREDLDFLIGKNADQEWISVYRGLSRVLTIKRYKTDSKSIRCDGADAYKKIMSGTSLYGKKGTTDVFLEELKSLVKIVSDDHKFDRYYKNEKEGFYQNELSRKYGICGLPTDDFVIVDKEAAVGYRDQKIKNQRYGGIQATYKEIQKLISDTDEKKFGKNLQDKSIGNELDFVALHKDGRLLLIEYKDGKNTGGIYLSPLQIGMYVELFQQLDIEEFKDSVLEMVHQKQQIGLINPKWDIPKIEGITPVLILSNYSTRSCAQEKFQDILNLTRSRKGPEFLSNLETYNYTRKSGLEKWL